MPAAVGEEQRLASFEDLLEAWDGETAVIRRDRESGGWIFICLHSTRLGPAGLDKTHMTGRNRRLKREIQLAHAAPCAPLAQQPAEGTLSAVVFPGRCRPILRHAGSLYPPPRQRYYLLGN